MSRGGKDYLKRCREVAKALEDSGALKDADAVMRAVHNVEKLYRERNRAVWQSRYARRQVAELIERVETILATPEAV